MSCGVWRRGRCAWRRRHRHEAHLDLFTTATRYDLIEHARNRFAVLLVVFFIPTWLGLVHLTIPDKAAPFRLASTGEKPARAGTELTQITGVLTAVTLVTGFMMFAATFTGGRFDRRLAMAGSPRTHLVLADGGAAAGFLAGREGPVRSSAHAHKRRRPLYL